ncbi:MAG: hypothetical protein ABJB55_09120, partial [Actinomycetota bacterium]
MTEFVVVLFSAALVVVAYLADRRYRRWAEETSLLAAPRARAATLQRSYRRKRSDVADATEVIGEIVGAVARSRSRATL